MEIEKELRGIFAALKKGIPGVDARLLKLLHDREWETRFTVAKVLRERAHEPFAKKIADRLGEEDHPAVRGELIGACGEILHPATLEALLGLAAKDRKKRTEERGRILNALRKHATVDARGYFEAIFAADLPEPLPPFDNQKEERVLAAWGLMKLGHDDEAHTFLVSMLEDRPQEVFDAIGEVKATDPGVAQRARQALIDLGHMTRRSRMPPPPPPSSERKLKAH